MVENNLGHQHTKNAMDSFNFIVLAGTAIFDLLFEGSKASTSSVLQQGDHLWSCQHQMRRVGWEQAGNCSCPCVEQVHISGCSSSPCHYLGHGREEGLFGDSHREILRTKHSVCCSFSIQPCDSYVGKCGN